ncbi:MAG: hypothetical protein ACK2T3_13015 [Candidatus Promineifilaceae bacterium]
MKLILLQCPNCSQALKPDNDDIVIACPNCHLAVHLGAAGLSITNIQYAVPTSRKGGDQSVWVPFWVFQGQIHIRKRDTQGRRSNTSDSFKTWEAVRRFFVPAWDVSVHTAQDLGTKLTLRQPDLQQISPPAPVNLIPVSVADEDALKMVEFIVLAIEARRKDWLKSLDFDVEVGEPVLFALPKGAY